MRLPAQFCFPQKNNNSGVIQYVIPSSHTQLCKPPLISRDSSGSNRQSFIKSSIVSRLFDCDQMLEHPAQNRMAQDGSDYQGYVVWERKRDLARHWGEKGYAAHAVTPPVLDYEQCALSTSVALEHTTCEPARGVLRTVSVSLLSPFWRGKWLEVKY